MHPCEVRTGKPEWQLHPGADLVLGEEFVGHPGDVGAGEQLAPRSPIARRVEDTRHAALDAEDHPLGQVADVDELRPPLGWPRREDLAAALDPARPVGEAPGRIVRPGDQAGPDAEAVLLEDLPDGLLAECLERAVVGVVRGKLVGGSVSQLGGRALLVGRDAEVRIDRDAGDEEVVAAVAELLGGSPHNRRDVTGRVDDCVKDTACEWGEIAAAVAAQLLDLREELCVRLAAVE